MAAPDTTRVERDAMGEVSVPVHVVCGEEDKVLPAKHAEGLPDSVAVTRLPGAGHIAHMEKASEINAIIKSVS